MELIGLNGKKGAGKDTVGAYLVEKYGFARLSFAGPLKQSALAALGIISPDAVAADDFWNEYKNDPDARITLSGMVDVGDGLRKAKNIVNISVREYLQFYGTEAHRDIFGADFWTKQLIDFIEQECISENNPDLRFVVTDARFVNECSAVREAGGVIIRIDRPGSDLADAHASEEDLPDELVDTVLYNNGTISALHTTIDAYLAMSGAMAPKDIASVE